MSGAGPPSSWEDASTEMDGFEQLLAMLPNFAGSGTSSSEHFEDPSQVPSPLLDLQAKDTMTPVQRKQQKNKVAQKRFRERQKASWWYRCCC